MFPYWGEFILFFQKGEEEEERKKEKVSTFFSSKISFHKVTF